MSFQCTIVTPEAQPFNAAVTSVVLPAHDGQLGLLTNRAPILVRLGAGNLKIETTGKEVNYYVQGGVAQMKDNKLTVLTHEAVPASEINAEAARTELANAEKLPAENPAQRETRSNAIRRAQAKLDVSSKK
jgi:F-type H+-transporting ATPase subunit epsilon